MTSAEMFQEFQVLLDKLDTQDLPDIPVEQFLILINLATDEYIQALRTAFESNKKIGEDASSLVKRIYIKPVVEDDRVKFSYSKAVLLEIPQGSIVYQPIYYLINEYFKSTWRNKPDDEGKVGISRATYTQQDDIVSDDPFNNPLFADKIPVVIEDYSLIATPPKKLTLNMLVGTAIIKPKKISQTQNSDLPEQIHHTLVKRTVELALENVESIRQKTFNQ